MGKLRLLLAVLLLIGAGGALWWIQFSPTAPQLSFARGLPSLPSNFRNQLADADKTIAQGIRDVAHGGIQLGETIPIDEFERVRQATVSAQVSMTPEEVWRTFREQGSQAVLSSIGSNIEYQVNDVSLSAANEARYQYCKGVVEAYENQ